MTTERRPGPGHGHLLQTSSLVALAMLAASAIALFLAPLLMPSSYSWVVNTTSESAAQGVEGAWLARIGLALFGLAVLAIWRVVADRWGRGGRIALASFGVLMLVTAVFSVRPWGEGAVYNEFEDLIHSLAATVMGFAFALGVFAVAVKRSAVTMPRRALDALAVLSSIAIPLSMMQWPGQAGLLQRLMFGIAYGWFAMEAVRPRDA